VVLGVQQLLQHAPAIDAEARPAPYSVHGGGAERLTEEAAAAAAAAAAAVEGEEEEEIETETRVVV
jgi:hypothetical protein